jgi:hypothetical protein
VPQSSREVFPVFYGLPVEEQYIARIRVFFVTFITFFRVRKKLPALRDLSAIPLL